MRPGLCKAETRARSSNADTSAGRSLSSTRVLLAPKVNANTLLWRSLRFFDRAMICRLSRKPQIRGIPKYEQLAQLARHARLSDMARTSHLKRIDSVINTHLHAAWQRARTERLDQMSSVRIEQNMFELVLTCDPTRTGRYAAWLARWRRRMWSIAGLRTMASIENLDALRLALKQFDSIRPNLLPANRDINLYANVEELLEAQTFLKSQDVRAARASERATAHAGSTILFDKDPWRLVRLNTAEAARWWGRGTRWCTSSRGPQAFDAYSSQGALLVLLTPQGRYQLATRTGEFMNAVDRPARLTEVLATAPSPLRQMLLP